MTSGLEEYLRRIGADLHHFVQLPPVRYGVTLRTPKPGQYSVADVPLRHFHKEWPISMDVMTGPPDEVPR